MSDTTIRLTIFLSVLLLMALLEFIAPKKASVQSRKRRWPTNLGLSIINTLVLRILGPVSAVSLADTLMYKGWGLLAQLPLPFYIDLVLAFILLDLAIYAQHIASHKIPLLWRIHRVHHADKDIDVTTALRFHPLEALISMLYKCLIIFLLGPVTIAVIVFETILNASAMFNHTNVKLPLGIDRYLRYFIVTPDMHRVHHSSTNSETDTNFGFCMAIWDRIFKTYQAQPSAGHQNIDIGLSDFSQQKTESLSWSLCSPFSSTNSNSPP